MVGPNKELQNRWCFVRSTTSLLLGSFLTFLGNLLNKETKLVYRTLTPKHLFQRTRKVLHMWFRPRPHVGITLFFFNPVWLLYVNEDVGPSSVIRLEMQTPRAQRMWGEGAWLQACGETQQVLLSSTKFE